MTQPIHKRGLLERIRAADSIEEVESLLYDALSFKQAAPETVRRWKKYAAKRIEALKP